MTNKTIREFIINFELNNSVENWQHDHTHIWPIFRILIYNETRDILQGVQNEVPLDWRRSIEKKPASFFQRVVSKLKSKFLKNKNTFNKERECLDISLPKADFVFFGSWYFRTEYKGRYVNKYFDSIIRYLKEKHNVEPLFFEYLGVGKMKNQISRIEEEVIDLEIFDDQLKRIDIQLEKQELFELFFKAFYANFTVDTFQDLDKVILRKINKVFTYKNLFKDIFSIVKPKYAICQTFFNEQMFGMIAAASEHNIKTIDLSHGYPLNENNIVYNKYCKCPSQGYNSLPDIFWVWDVEVLNAMKLGWLDRQSQHKAYVIGNPWLESFKNNSYVEKESLKPFVLYTTSTNFPNEKMLSLMRRTQNQYEWWIRVHPSIKGSLAELEVHLKNNNVYNYGLVEANQYPLPFLLLSCTVHFSNFSSTIYESCEMGNVPIIVDEEGEKAYKVLINQGRVLSSLNLCEDDIIQKMKSVTVLSVKKEALKQQAKFIKVVDLIVNNVE